MNRVLHPFLHIKTHIIMTFRRDKQFCQAENHEALAEGNKCEFAWYSFFIEKSLANLPNPANRCTFYIKYLKLSWKCS